MICAKAVKRTQNELNEKGKDDGRGQKKTMKIRNLKKTETMKR